MRTMTRSNSTYRFPIQKSPPLSLLQYARTAADQVDDRKGWLPSGRYHPPPFRQYMSPRLQEQKKTTQPTWKPIGPYRETRPTSLDPEVIRQVKVQLPAWKPAGKIENKPIPFFDPPSLRWSLTQLRRSMSDLQRSMYTSQNLSARSARSAKTRPLVDSTVETQQKKEIQIESQQEKENENLNENNDENLNKTGPIAE